MFVKKSEDIRASVWQKIVLAMIICSMWRKSLGKTFVVFKYQVIHARVSNEVRIKSKKKAGLFNVFKKINFVTFE